MTGSLSGSDNGIVGVGIRVYQHPDTPTTFREIAKMARDTNKTISQAAAESSRNRIAADRAAEREADRLHTRHRQRQLERAKDSRRAGEDEAKENARLTSLQIANAKRAQREQDRAAASVATTFRKIAAEKERADAKAAAATAYQISGYKLVADGVTKIGRAIMLLGGDSKEIDSIIEKLLIYEGLVQGAKGFGSVARGVGRIFGGRAVGGAVAAGAATAASSAGTGIAAGAGGLTAGAATTAGAGASATAGVGLVAATAVAVDLKLFHEAITGNAKNLNSWTNKIAEAEIGVAKWFHNLTGINALAPFGADVGRLNAQDKKTKRMVDAGRNERSLQERFTNEYAIRSTGEDEGFQFELERRRRYAGYGKTGAAYDEAVNRSDAALYRQRLTDAKSDYARANAGVRTQPGENLDAVMARAFERIKESAMALVKLEEDRHQIVKTELMELKGRYMSEAERFASLKPYEAEATLSAASRARRGEKLDYNEAGLLRGYSEFQNNVNDATVRRAREMGGGFILDPLQKQIAKREMDLKVNIGKTEITLKADDASLRGLGDDIATQVTDQISAYLKDFETGLQKQIQQNVDLMQRRLNDEQSHRKAQIANGS